MLLKLVTNKEQANTTISSNRFEKYVLPTSLFSFLS